MTIVKDSLSIYRHRCTQIKTNTRFDSILEASNKTGICKDYILNCCIWFDSIEKNEYSKKFEWTFTSKSIGYGEYR